VGGVAWHQYLAVKKDNEKLAGKVGSVQINNHNIFHRYIFPVLACLDREKSGNPGKELETAGKQILGNKGFYIERYIRAQQLFIHSFYARYVSSHVFCVVCKQPALPAKPRESHSYP
jgi:hypothetical protein